MRWLMGIAITLLFAGQVHAQPASKIARIRTSPYSGPYSVIDVSVEQERQLAIQQLGTAIETLRQKAIAVSTEADQSAKDRRAAIEAAIAQLQQHQTAAQSNAAAVPAAFTKLDSGAIGRPRVSRADIMQIVDDKSVLVTGSIGAAASEVVLVRGIKTDDLVDAIELKQLFRVSGQHKYKAGGKEVAAPILELFDAGEFAAK